MTILFKTRSGAVLLVAAAMLTGCGSDKEAAAVKPKTFDAHLELLAALDGADLMQTGMAMEDPKFTPGDTPCLDDAGVVDEGTEVTVRNTDGKILAFGRAQEGLLGAGPKPIYAPCVFKVDIPKIPADQDMYSLEIDGVDMVTVTKAELQKDGLTVGVGYQD